MDWRVLMRRCPSRSFTVVGDLAQRRSAAGATSWDTMLEPYVPGRWVYRSLSVNYRTPAEIMTVAAALLAEFAPGVQPPESVRACGVQPWSRQVTEDELPSAIEEFVRDEAGREGTSVVIGPAGRAGRGAGVGDEGPGVRRRAGGGAGTDPRRRPTRRGRALRRPHPRHPAPRRPAPGPVAAGPEWSRRCHCVGGSGSPRRSSSGWWAWLISWWCGAVGPGQAAVFGDGGLQWPSVTRAWSGPHAKYSASASVAPSVGPGWAVVHLAVIARCQHSRVGCSRRRASSR